MLSILNETKTKVFQQEQLTVRIFPSIQEMGSVAAKEVGDQICRLLESKPEINMIFAAAPSQNEFLSHLIHDKRIDWTRINAFHMDRIDWTQNKRFSYGRIHRYTSGSPTKFWTFP